MKTYFASLVICCLAAGCSGEPTTPREEAEQAQQDLEEARDEAADMIASSEEDAVDILADAKHDAADEINDAKRDAAELVDDAEQDLAEKLQELNAPENVQSTPQPPTNQPEIDQP